MKSARTIGPIVVKTEGWGTFATLPSATRLRAIKKDGAIWRFDAWDPESKTWTPCSTKNDLGEVLGKTPARKK